MPPPTINFYILYSLLVSSCISVVLSPTLSTYFVDIPSDFANPSFITFTPELASPYTL